MPLDHSEDEHLLATGGLAELIDNGATGLLFTAEDADALVATGIPYLGHGQHATFLKELVVPCRYDYLDRHDLRPAGRAARGLAGTALRRAIGRTALHE